MLVLITAMGITATNRTIVEGWLSANYRSSKQAFYVAEAGLEYTRNYLRTVPDWTVNTAVPRVGTINVGGREATYTITLRDATPNSIIITSTGVIVGATAVVEALIRRHTISVPASVYLGGADVEAEFSGNAFRIDGNDFDRTAPPLWGIAIGPNADFDVKFNPIKGKDRIIGSPGTIEAPASIGRVSQPLNLVALAEQFVSIANRTITEDHRLEGNTVWGTTTHPEVSYVDGDLEMRGNSRGAGVLIVRGDLEMQGSPRWDGIIIVLSEEMEAEQPDDAAGNQAGTPNIYGALLIRGDEDTELNVRGNITIQYSSRAINMLNMIAPITVSSWRQVHN
jgi:hypothetical protein